MKLQQALPGRVKMNDLKKQNFWGKGISLLYLLFVIFILTIVFVASYQDFHMVESNYYQKELDYQNRIDEINNTKQLRQKPTWAINQKENIISLRFPDSMAISEISGEILFYRPSDAGLDITTKIEPDSNGMQFIKIKNLVKGRWEMKIRWHSGERSYYYEDVFYKE